MDWKRKLTSRKLWVAIASFIASILIACNVDENLTSQVVTIIMGFATVITYIFVEGNIDSSSKLDKKDGDNNG